MTLRNPGEDRLEGVGWVERSEPHRLSSEFCFIRRKRTWGGERLQGPEVPVPLHEPAAETRNRKPMRPNPFAPWELRIGDLRVYYEIVEDAEAVVTIVAIGVKERDRILIGGKEIKL
jgi:hypothetical protein